MTINTIEPRPSARRAATAASRFDLGHIPAGERYVLFLQFQVNPTNVGRRATGRRALRRRHTLLTRRPHTITVLP